MDIRLIAETGVEERGVEDLPILLQGEKVSSGWTSSPGTMRQYMYSRMCSGFTRWP